MIIRPSSPILCLNRLTPPKVAGCKSAQSRGHRQSFHRVCHSVTGSVTASCLPGLGKVTPGLALLIPLMLVMGLVEHCTVTVQLCTCWITADMPETNEYQYRLVLGYFWKHGRHWMSAAQCSLRRCHHFAPTTARPGDKLTVPG